MATALRTSVSVLVLAWVTLWGLYRFRFNESPVGLDQFNRPLATKIADLHSPLLRNTVSLMVRTHFMPRSYLWGLADILHVGVEGRVFPLFFLGHTYLERAPFYFFPTVLLVKLPLGLIALTLVGLVLVLKDRTWPGKEPLLVILLFGALLLLMLIKGTSSYAGIRHAQIVIPPLAVLAAAGLSVAWERRSRIVLVGVGIATLAAMVSAIPVMRPWLYYNKIIGTDNAWRYFSDEGTDFGQRTKEIAAYYHQKLEPKGEIPYLEYLESYAEDDRRGIRSMQAEWKSHPETDTSNVVSGVFMIPATVLLSDPVIDYTPFLAAKPVDRFGVMLVYRGTFNLPGPRASRFYSVPWMRSIPPNPTCPRQPSIYQHLWRSFPMFTTGGSSWGTFSSSAACGTRPCTLMKMPESTFLPGTRWSAPLRSRFGGFHRRT